MSLGFTGLVSLAVYSIAKVPEVTGSILSYMLLGPKPGQEDSDTRTVAFIAAMRSATGDGDRITVENIQVLTGRKHPCPSHTWGIRTKYDIPNGAEIEKYIDEAIAKCRPDDVDPSDLPKAKYAPCSGEWQAPRKFKGTISDLTGQEKYNLMHEECKDKDTVILYLHGGAHYLGNETGHRPLVRKITKMSGYTKAFSVNYRLSPQNPFPAALTDALAAYEYLVKPPKGALHKAVQPKHIILAGDSAGGNLASALMVTLIESRPRWELPGGLVLLSPWGDLTHSLPSCRYAPNDYLPDMVGPTKSHKPSQSWASDGSQRQFYCQNTMLLHPLVSPIAYQNWSALKSVIIQTGAEERLRDEGRYMAQHMDEHGVQVQYHEYQSMPHVFQALFHTSASYLSLKSIGEYIRLATRGQKIVGCQVLRNGKGEEKPFGEGQLERYVHASLLETMMMARKNFGQPWPQTKSVL